MPEAADRLYDRLVQLHTEAFEAGRYELAYHLLAAALHAAEELNSADLLHQVERMAGARQADIDRFHPEHKVSTASSHGRGNFSLFTALAGTASAVRGRMAADQAVERLRQKGEAAR
jgi:hypothetical protein